MTARVVLSRELGICAAELPPRTRLFDCRCQRRTRDGARCWQHPRREAACGFCWEAGLGVVPANGLALEERTADAWYSCGEWHGHGYVQDGSVEE